MAEITMPGMLLTGNHASRPAANAVGGGTLYACSTHGLVYQSDTSAWTTWATLGTPGAIVDPMTTRGDIIVRDASNVTARKAVGAANRLLGSDGTDPSWRQATEADLNLTDVTTGNASTSAHGFLKKLDNSASHFMDGTGAWSTPSGTGVDPNHAAYAYLAATLEPLAVSYLRWGAFTQAMTTQLLLSAWNCRLGSSGRYDMREPGRPQNLNGQTLTGLGSGATGSTAAMIDPSLPTYTDARTTYFDRQKALLDGSLSVLYVPLVGGDATSPLLPGPYGSIINGFSFHDTPWIGLITPLGPSGSLLTIHNEIGDASGDDTRSSERLWMAVSHNICAGLKLGTAGGPDSVLAGLTYINVPSTWGKVTDSNSYSFRDDFMGTSLDTATKWTRTQSTAGNVEISTAGGFANWCKARGDGTWGDNGMIAQTSVTRATDKKFECFVYIDAAHVPASNSPNMLVGWHDGSGLLHTDFAHGIDFTSAGTAALNIFENGNSRGAVGSGWTPGAIYRIRITLNPGGAANTAKYEIQGGPEYEPIGKSTWTDITPGTTSSSTSPVYAGMTVKEAFNEYIGDMKTY